MTTPRGEERGYQLDFASSSAAMFDIAMRERKARTMVTVLSEFLAAPLAKHDLLNVGGSAGFIDNHLAEHFGRVVGIDIDAPAIEHARASFRRPNLEFRVADAMKMPFPAASFDVAVCSQVYEHVPDASQMMGEIYRVLRGGGVCYFAASNRLRWMEPHYRLPLLSVVPRAIAHSYVRWAGRAERYHELHFSYWGLRRLVRRFHLHDWTPRMLRDPERYGIEYMVPPGTLRAFGARIVTRFAHWASPGYIWLLEKPADATASPS